MAVSLVGALTIILYYIAVVTVGVWAGRKVLRSESPLSQSVKEGSPGSRPFKSSTMFRTPIDNDNGYLLRLFLANRSVPLTLSFLSMTATWVGGGYLNGTAEAVFNYGIVWCHAPIGYALSLVIGGRFFAGKMRVTKALTMFDPFQQHYGRWIAVPLCLPALCGEVFWTAAILAALGDTVAAITRVDSSSVIMLSSAIILFYTSLGGLYSVIYTDAFQVVSTVFGLVYFQRVLCSETVFTAKMLSYLAAAGCCFLAIPPIIIGALAKSCNFTAAGYQGPFNLAEEERPKVLPHALHHMTPSFVAVLGQLAITAAVMSSVDSSMLSASQLITRNIYHVILRPSATDLEMCVVLRCMICLVGVVATSMALRVSSVLSLWTLSSDLVYVLLFPQFVALFFLRHRVNAYGSALGFFAGLVLRFLCGEPAFGLPALLQLPLYDSERGQQFPFRTLCMMLSLSGQLLGSAATAAFFRVGHFRDYWHCFEGVAGQSTDAGAAAAAPVPSCTSFVPLLKPDDPPDDRHHEAAGAAPHNKAHQQQHHHLPHHEPPEAAAVGTAAAAGSAPASGTAMTTGASESDGGEEKARRRSSSKPSEAGSPPKKAKRRRTSGGADSKPQGPQGSHGSHKRKK
ncbi:high-affinity choline transporter 1-like isoform X2 [Dermacentor albipictus]|uniref:high-affinity choline transporter 1-like isoform X2 n=1 Tax=Dermacentor albipictus TaxID=60249 RepID=UPI0031FDDB83